MNTMIGRIQMIIKSKGLSPSLFADKIGVQRSGVSHLLSGRNKPSLEFIIKILNAFPDIDADWLLFGHGEMKHVLTGYPERDSVTSPDLTKKTGSDYETNQAEIKHQVTVPDNHDFQNQSEIDKVIILFKDRTFQEYKIQKEGKSQQ